LSPAYDLNAVDKYSSVLGNTEVRQILSGEDGVIALYQDKVKYLSRGGVARSSYRYKLVWIILLTLCFRNDNMRGLNGVVFSTTSTTDTVTIGGETHLFIYGLGTSRLLKEVCKMLLALLTFRHPLLLV
jgi:hypothetical protein